MYKEQKKLNLSKLASSVEPKSLGGGIRSKFIPSCDIIVHVKVRQVIVLHWQLKIGRTQK